MCIRDRPHTLPTACAEGAQQGSDAESGRPKSLHDPGTPAQRSMHRIRAIVSPKVKAQHKIVEILEHYMQCSQPITRAATSWHSYVLRKLAPISPESPAVRSDCFSAVLSLLGTQGASVWAHMPKFRHQIGLVHTTSVHPVKNASYCFQCSMRRACTRCIGASVHIITCRV